MKCAVVKVISKWMIPEMALTWVAVYVERIQSAQPAYESQYASNTHIVRERIGAEFGDIRTGLSGGRLTEGSCACA